MSEPAWALFGLVLACQGLRAAGLWLAGPLRADHWFIRWAASVAVATLAAFVLLAVVAPSGTTAALPWPARAAGALACLAVVLGMSGERVLAALLAGLGTAGAVWWALETV